MPDQSSSTPSPRLMAAVLAALGILLGFYTQVPWVTQYNLDQRMIALERLIQRNTDDLRRIDTRVEVLQATQSYLAANQSRVMQQLRVLEYGTDPTRPPGVR